MDLLLPNGLPWSVHRGTSDLLQSTILLQKLVADGLVSTELVTSASGCFPQREEGDGAGGLGRRIHCGSRYKAVDSQKEGLKKSYMLLTESYAWESTGIERAKIHASFSTTKNECGREVRAPTTIHARSRAASLKADYKSSPSLPPLNLVMDSLDQVEGRLGYNSIGWRRRATKIKAMY
ncbi:hypothetical protein ARMGADRAFT_822428 [Armillaria gallica]|uniref:Uncharacterized protein n=1 Tax=Armillaria gallica TaxID=47427 RepID=A0A2H3CCE8_ARMGA|nr:hypothetical protein ARMGADRAFT_822428 [Armillaria gallica]